MAAEPQRPLPAALARRVRIVVLDVDGVLTDGGVYLGATDAGERVELKRFDIQDGAGIRLLQEAGIPVAIVTARQSHAVRLRAAELGIAECHQGPGVPKLRTVGALLERLGVGWHEAAFVGDDLPDVPVLRRVGLPVAVANASDEVRAVAAWQTRRAGGAGAVRELAEALLRARGSWAATVQAYLRAQESPA